MHIQTISEAPVNRRGGQVSYLLLTRGQFGSQNLAITWVEGAPGSEQPVHAHADSEQVYVVVSGSGLMKAGNEQREVARGTVVFIRPGARHAIRNAGSEPLVYVSATSPPFDPHALPPELAYGPPA